MAVPEYVMIHDNCCALNPCLTVQSEWPMRTLLQLRRGGVFFVGMLLLLGALPPIGAAQTIPRCGKGCLELSDGYPASHPNTTHSHHGYPPPTPSHHHPRHH